VVVSSCYLIYLDFVGLEEIYLLWFEVWLKIIVTQRAYLLGIHPVKETLFTTVAPCPNISIFSQYKSVIFT
jgi:hypothetical protein